MNSRSLDLFDAELKVKSPETIIGIGRYGLDRLALSAQP